MRRLLQFIYGLLLILWGMAIIKFYFVEFEHWFRWVNVFIAILLVNDGRKKLEKATEKQDKN